MAFYTVDRTEGDYIILELPDGSSVSMPKALCPYAKEGDVVSVDIIKEKRDLNMQKAKAKMDSIFKE